MSPTKRSGKNDTKIEEESVALELKPLQADYTNVVDAGASDADALDAVLSIPRDDALPWEETVLPSKGLYYDGKIPEGKIKVRPMGLYVEKILANQRLAATGQSLDQAFRKCVDFGTDFDPLDLLVGDRMFLLYYLRGITHGPNYDFTITCTDDACQELNVLSYDLTNVMNTVTYGDPTLGEEPFKVILPYMSKASGRDFWVKVRFSRGHDLQLMMDRQRKKPKIKKKSKNLNDFEAADETVSENLYTIITEAMGSTDKSKVRELVERLHSADTTVIRSFLDDHQPGIDLNIEVDCQHCGNTMNSALPLSENFFRPKRR